MGLVDSDVTKPLTRVQILNRLNSGPFYFNNDISPAAIAADTNNYAPTGLSTATVLRLSATGSTRTVTGLTGGTDGRILIVHNVGAIGIVFADESGSSTNVNRFALNGDITLGGDTSVALQYDSTAQRWRAIGVGVGQTFSSASFVDSGFRVVGSSDATKKLAFEVDGFTAATTRTLTPQDASYTLAGTNIAQTFSAAQTFGSTVSVIDGNFSLLGSSDATKIAKFEVDGLTASTTRTYTLPDANIVVSGSASALTSGRVPFATTGGLLTDSTNLTWNGSTFTVGASTASTSTTTGAHVVTGGVGIGGAVFVGSTLSVAGSVSLTAAANHYLVQGRDWRWTSDGTSSGTLRGAMTFTSGEIFFLTSGASNLTRMQVGAAGDITHTYTDAATNTTPTLASFNHVSTATLGTVAAGFGTSFDFGATSTTSLRTQAQIQTAWIDSTDATRKARVYYYVRDTSAREFMRADATGSACTIAFNGGNVLVGTLSDDGTNKLQVAGAGKFTGQLTATAGTASTSTTTGTAVVTGGVGISGALYVGSTIVAPASIAGAAPLRIPHGTAPSSPVDGDLWTTVAGLFVRVNGVTVGPLI